jgi:hypothetical protein
MSIRSVLALCAVVASTAIAGVAYATAPAAGSGDRITVLGGAEAWEALVVAHVAVADQQQPQQQPQQKKHPRVDFSQSCVECHTRRTASRVEAWQQSAHNPNVGCFVCHGDPETDFVAKPTNTACMSCHATKAAAMERAQVSSCFTCHDGHRLKFHIN